MSIRTCLLIFCFYAINKVMVAAGIGLCTRVSQEYGPRYGPVRTYSFRHRIALLRADVCLFSSTCALQKSS